jgi:HD-GYP domain-containing protein (c-di-GMP phosphodiesterase class II)
LNKDLFAKNVQKEREIISSHLMLMDVLGKMVAKRDSDTGVHNSRVTYMAVRIAEELEHEQDEMQSLIAGSFLHDIGKVAIPDGILLKPAGFTEEEWVTMKSHVFHGEQLVQNIGWLNIAYDVVAGHHEKWDGSGYPDGLKGEAIPLSARLMALADVFDALTTRRVYKPAFAHEEARRIILEDRGRHFDPVLVDIFEERFDEFREIALRYVDQEASA